MLIWLPPSEGKTAPPADGPAVDLASLLLPELTEQRSQVMAALAKVSQAAGAAQTLGLGPKTAAEVSLNCCLKDSPCAPALELYTGVLYDALGADTLSAQGRSLLSSSTWILSALFGFVRPEDLLPNHRLAMGVSLPPLGTLTSWWRPRLDAVIGADVAGQTVFDCRPGAYRNAYPARTADVVELLVTRQGPEGRSAVTHLVKQWRGWAVRWLLDHSRVDAASSRADLLEALSELRGHRGILDVEVADAKSNRHGGSSTVVRLITV